MKKNNRVKANEDFSTIIKKGRAFKNSNFTIHYLENNENVCRIGVSVSTKLGNAVVRSRIRRQIRSMCESLIDFNSIAIDIIIIARNGFLNLSFAENKQVLEEVFKKIGII